MQIAKALQFATEKHKGQKRRLSGEDYVQHVIRVGDTVAKYVSNSHIIIAGILHDILEDTDTTYEELVTNFGVKVAVMVLALTNDEAEMAKEGGKRQYLAKKINTLLPDELFIKLADRLDNISDLTDNAWSRKYCEETRYIFLETLCRKNLSDNHKVLLEQIRVRVEECERICALQQQ